mgnify:CR=1 FL=1|jgi:hypothetical protein
MKVKAYRVGSVTGSVGLGFESLRAHFFLTRKTVFRHEWVISHMHAAIP